MPREEILAGPRVTGRWAVLARTVIEQERLRVQRTWLWGERPALLLDFAPPGAPLAPRPAPGTEISAALAFHPGAAPLRALLASEPETVGRATGFGGGSVAAALDATALALAANPWLEEWPVALAAATPDVTAGDWTLNADGSLPLGGPPGPVWRLLALSGGHPVSVFGLWNGARLEPLAASDGERVVPL